MEKTETKYVKRTQKDYSMSFKLSVVHEYETTKISLEALKRKYVVQGEMPRLDVGLKNMVTLISQKQTVQQDEPC